MKLLHFFFAFLLVTTGFAQRDDIPPRPDPPRLVNNLSQKFPDFISSSQQAALEQKLDNFSNQTSNQIVIAIVDDIGGTDMNSYATNLGHKWGVGTNKFDNGIVILVKPDEHDVYIAVGYGLEGAIPDMTAGQIIDNEIVPRFRNGDYYGGLDAATDRLMELAKGEYNAQQYATRRQSSHPNRWIFWLIAIILILVLSRIFRGGGGGGMTIGRRGYWGGGFGGYGGFGGSSWGGGGSGGGGFGGFGGGGFGGGGAGGKW